MKKQIKLIMFLILIGLFTNDQSNEQENRIGKESIRDHVFKPG
jgi:hypothetical protein